MSRIFIFLIAICLLSACGQSGRLYLPNQKMPPVATPQPSSQEDNDY